MSVIEIHGDAEWNAQMQRAGGKLVVVDFSATWCVFFRASVSLFREKCEGALRSRAMDLCFNPLDVDHKLMRFSPYGMQLCGKVDGAASMC